MHRVRDIVTVFAPGHAGSDASDLLLFLLLLFLLLLLLLLLRRLLLPLLFSLLLRLILLLASFIKSLIRGTSGADVITDWRAIGWCRVKRCRGNITPCFAVRVLIRDGRLISYFCFVELSALLGFVQESLSLAKEGKTVVVASTTSRFRDYVENDRSDFWYSSGSMTWKFDGARLRAETEARHPRIDDWRVTQSRHCTKRSLWYQGKERPEEEETPIDWVLFTIH